MTDRHPTDAQPEPQRKDGAPDIAERPARIPWPPILILITLITGLALGRLVPLGWPGLNDTPATVVGYGLGLCGLALIIWASLTMRRHRTNILPHKGADQLVTDGPFAWRRNPIYLGDALIFLGIAQATLNIWFVLLVPVFMLAVTWLAILPEERHLEAKFGDAYRTYKAQTRRWL